MNANKQKYMPLVVAAGQKHGIDPNIIAGLIDTENAGWVPDLRTSGNSSAVGLGQFTKGTAKRYGVDPTDAASSIDGAARYLADLKKRYKGDMSLAIRAYHDGEGSVDELLAGRTNAITSTAESRGYVKKVLAAAKANGAAAVTDNASNLAGAPSLITPQPAQEPLVKKMASVQPPAPAPAPAPLDLQPVPTASPPAPTGVQPQPLFASSEPGGPDLTPPPMHLTELLQDAAAGRGPRLVARRPSGYDAILDSILG